MGEIRVFITPKVVDERIQSIKQQLIDFCENVLELEDVKIDLKVIKDG